jgi:phosphoribosylanthranilate isomerase
MKLKVCGVRTLSMAQACQDLSVPYVGFNFVPTSKRYIEPSQAQSLSHAYTGYKVGVFQNASVETITKTAQIVDLDIIQLHGNEEAAFIKNLKASLVRIKPFRIWKAFGVNKNLNLEYLQQYSKNCDLLLFDGTIPGSGTQIVNHEALLEAINASSKLSLPYALAGGINPTTVSKNLAQFHAAALFDTASGVETNGQFESAKLESLLTLLEDA